MPRAMYSLTRSIALLAGALVVACTDAPTATAPAPAAPRFESGGRGDFQRYAAIGTSVSMGWQSDGVIAAGQATSWPAQLARLAHRELSLPGIAFPGCGAPLAAPLASGRRISGELATAPGADRVCAPNEPGVVLPADNLAINGALTIDALRATPEDPDPDNARLYARVLPPGMSQVSAMMALDPKLVSVELGGNEVLGALYGFVRPGVNVVPVAAWEPAYLQVLDAVERTAKHAVLVGLMSDVARFSGLRTGAEMWQARAIFQTLGVAVAPDCAGSPNLLFVRALVPIAAGVTHALSCADGWNGSLVDYVLTPADAQMVNAQLAAMNAIIRREAARRGFAYFALAALYENPVVKPATFNPYDVLFSNQPFGPYISLDGVHPTAAGSTLLAHAAAAALNARYDFGIPIPGSTLALALR